MVLAVPARLKPGEIIHEDGRMPDSTAAMGIPPATAPRLGLGHRTSAIRKSARHQPDPKIIWHSLAIILWCPLHSSPLVLKGSLFTPRKARKLYFIMSLGSSRKAGIRLLLQFNQSLLQAWDGNTAINLLFFFSLGVSFLRFCFGFWVCFVFSCLGFLDCFVCCLGFFFPSKDNHLSIPC